MKLYYSKGACSLAPRIIINEIGLKVDFEAVNLKTKTTETGQDFLKINPKGSVPVLEIKSGVVLTENPVILQYLADQANATYLLPAFGDFKRYRVLEWLNYVTTELHKGVGILFNPAITENMRDTVFVPLIKTKLTYLDNHLKDNTYLLGEQWMLPDGYLFVVLTWLPLFNIDLGAWSHLARYFHVLEQCDSIQQSLRDESL